MNIKVLGSGCSNCKKLEKNVLEALKAMSLEAEVEKVTDLKDIMSYNIMKTPALVIDGKVVLSGQVPSPQKLQELFK
jgi:small redox-active disulfide protein 2